MIIEQLFFELIQVSLGTRICLTHTPTADEWGELYAMSKKQSLVGICFSAVQKLTQNQEPITHNLDEVQYLTWMGMAAKIQQKNEQMNVSTKEALAFFRRRGFACQILKGQGIAKLYGSLSVLRQSGDIDVWMSGGKEAAFALSKKELGRVQGLTNYHIHFPIMEDAEIELHFKPSFLSSPLRNKRFLEFCRLYEPTKDEKRIVSEDSINYKPSTINLQDTPSLAFNRIYILLHCYRHLCGHGVGMRQLLDYYFVLLHSANEVSGGSHDSEVSNQNYKAESMKWIEDLGMKRFAEATMWFMQYVFGLEDKYLLCEPAEKAGRFLLNEVMHSGNMGHGEDRFDGKISQSAIARYWYNLKRDIRLIQICPHEALWDPVFNVYQFIWCKFQKTK